MANYLCIDIGGTNIKYGIATETGKFLCKKEMPTETIPGKRPPFIAKLQGVISKAQKDYAVQGVAVATSGIVDSNTGVIVQASSNIPGYQGTELKKILEQGSNLPVTVENDVNAAALGEFWLGAGHGAQSLFCLAVGTGIGGGLILDGKLVRGATFSAGEVGYMHLGLGKSFEHVAAMPSLIADVAEAKHVAPNTLNGKLIFRMVQAKDEVAIKAVQKMVKILATGIADVCYLLNPEMIVLGGGIMEQEAYLRPLFEKELSALLIPYIYNKTQLKFAQLGNSAGMTGALYNFLHQ
jgi:predicted NBD/HSP70 family sugar kinase